MQNTLQIVGFVL